MARRLGGGSGGGGGGGRRESLLRGAWRRLCDPGDAAAGAAVAAALCVAEAVMCCLIVWRVPYTEIDWEAYMSQVAQYSKGERDYAKIRGGTGPIVYPAGFVHIYAWLRDVTGGQVFPAQVLFSALYIFELATVFMIYIRCKAVPPWALALLCLSKRLHSIFILRLFNDGVGMAFVYLSILVLMISSPPSKQQSNNSIIRPVLALVIFSLGVSVKMNALLFAPSLLLVLVLGSGVVGAVVAIGAAGVVQFGRVFVHRWSVNLKFLPEEAFLSKTTAAGLLAGHLGCLAMFAHVRWTRSEGGLLRTIRTSLLHPTRQKSLSPAFITAVVFEGNFIGIVFARTLHYQFYAWYFHTLPFLLWKVDALPSWGKVGVMLGVEYCWNVFPSTPSSSALLLALHAGVVVGLAFAPAPIMETDTRQRVYNKRRE
eukprot:jgi/Chlat1/6441/Chrsp45S09065